MPAGCSQYVQPACKRADERVCGRVGLERTDMGIVRDRTDATAILFGDAGMRQNREEYLEQAHYNALRGNELPQAKLNPSLVREIRSSNEPRKAIANRLGVHYRTIEKVRQWETWVHVR